jgi:hypothetical protein
MNYQVNVEEAKQLIGDMALEIFALRRDNIKLSEALQKIHDERQETSKVARMPDPRQDLNPKQDLIEREING